MKKATFIVFILIALTSCATYNAHFPQPSERVNPYDQQPVPDDGLAGFARDVIKR